MARVRGGGDEEWERELDLDLFLLDRWQDFLDEDPDLEEGRSDSSPSDLCSFALRSRSRSRRSLSEARRSAR